MLVAGGPRDWTAGEPPDDPPRGDGATPRASPRRATTGWLVVISCVLALLVALVLTRPTETSPQQFAPNNLAPLSTEPPTAVFSSAAQERAALDRELPEIGGRLTSDAQRGIARPTGFDITSDGALSMEPTDYLLGVLPAGTSIEWTADAAGRVTTLTLIGPTFSERVPLDVSAIDWKQPSGGTA